MEQRLELTEVDASIYQHLCCPDDFAGLNFYCWTLEST